MKKIWLMGGFGNILFQILVYNILIKKKLKVKFVETLTNKNIFTKLLKWTIHEKSYYDLIDKNQIIKISNLKATLIFFIALMSKIKNKGYNKSSFYNKELKLSDLISSNIFGYFQDKSFLEDNREEIVSLGKKIRNIYGEDKNLIVVHYRKGDSIWVRECKEYYEKVRLIIDNENREVIIVTDSIEDAKLFFNGCNNIKIIKSENAIQDFRYLVSANIIFCGPSTFSWWAAHSLKENSIIYCPKILEDKLGFYFENQTLFIL